MAEKFGSREAGSKGGRARADALSKAKRSAIAREAAIRRWSDSAGIATATHDGVLPLASIKIPCAVLEDGTRVLTQFGFLQAIGRSGRPAAGRGSSFERRPPFLDSDNLQPFVDADLLSASKAITFRTPSGGIAHGYRAELLPRVCEVYLKARDSDSLRADQLKFAVACDLIVRGLAHVGIVALVDEATGYQKDRARDALAKVLEEFVAKELQKWVSTFGLDYYQQMFRLWNQPYDASRPTMRRPQFFGRLTNNIVYSRLAPGVLEELRRLNPADEQGKRQKKHFQHLTPQLGHPRLKEHLAAVTALMRASKTKADFMKLLDTALPKFKFAPLFNQA